MARRMLGAVPARFDSRRPAGKVLRAVAGRPMPHWACRKVHRTEADLRRVSLLFSGPERG